MHMVLCFLLNALYSNKKCNSRPQSTINDTFRASGKKQLPSELSSHAIHLSLFCLSVCNKPSAEESIVALCKNLFWNVSEHIALQFYWEPCFVSFPWPKEAFKPTMAENSSWGKSRSIVIHSYLLFKDRMHKSVLSFKGREIFLRKKLSHLFHSTLGDFNSIQQKFC